MPDTNLPRDPKVTSLASLSDDRNTLTIAVGDQPYEITAGSIARNWDALSHFPERRARLEIEGLGARLNRFAAHVEAIVAAGGQIDLATEVARYHDRHVSLTRRAWAMDSRCMSWFVVGPARFPVERNAKRLSLAENAFRALSEHVQAACEAVTRRAWPHGAPGGAIRAANPDAPDLLRAEIAKRRETHAAMKAANAALRATNGQDIEARVQAVVDATGFRESIARTIVCPPQPWMGQGFAAYALSGESAEIKRLEGRLRTIEANRARGEVKHQHNTTAGAVEVVENPDAARIQIVFPGKPDERTRSLLKSNGFRWAPSAGAWQRHLNNAGRWAAERVVSGLQIEEAV